MLRAKFINEGAGTVTKATEVAVAVAVRLAEARFGAREGGEGVTKEF